MPADAASIMTRHVISPCSHDTVARIAKLLLTHRSSAAPVCDTEGQLLAC
jgi:CBS-domain-containing membrane protein